MLRTYHMTSVWSEPKYFPKDSMALYCVNHAVWPSTFLMLCPPIHPQAQIILGKYHKREDFRIEVRPPSSSTNWGKESPCIWKNPISNYCQTNLWWSYLTLIPKKPQCRPQMNANLSIVCFFPILMTVFLGFSICNSINLHFCNTIN